MKTKTDITETNDSMDNDCDPMFIRSDLIKQEYLESGCQSSDMDEAIEKLMCECGELFENADHATSFLMEELHENIENERNEKRISPNRPAM